VRVEIELGNGKKVWVGGRPLMAATELHRLFPDLGKAIETHDAIVEEAQAIPDGDLEAVQRIWPRFEAAKNEICVQIIQLFNSGFGRSQCLIDADTYNDILAVWGGSYEKKK